MADHSQISNIIPVVVLNGSNFLEWKFRTRLALQAQGLESHIDDNVPVAANLTADWKKSDAKAKKIIVDRINAEQLHLIMHLEYAKQMMDEFNRLYAEGDSLNAVHLRRQLADMKYKEGNDPHKHLSDFEILIGRLKNCGRNLNEQDKIAYLMDSFPDSFDSVIAYFDALSDNERTFMSLRTRFLRECKKKEDQNGKLIEKKEEEPAAFWNQGRNQSNFRRPDQHRSNDRHGSSNNRSNHQSKHSRNSNQSNSYNRSNGYNRSYGHSNNSRGSRGNRQNSGNYNNQNRSHGDTDRSNEFTCFVCNKPGHLAKNCNVSNKKAFYTVSLLSNNSSEISKNSIQFFFDSGATDHMISSKYDKFLKNVEYFESPLAVQTSKCGINLMSYSYGDLDVYFNGESYTLENVLCVDDLGANLISVNRLDRKGFSITFEDGGIGIFDHNELIVFGKQESNLYTVTFDLEQKVKANYSHSYPGFIDGNAKLWHDRFGHVNYVTLNRMKNKGIVNGLTGNFLEDVDNIDKCDVCILSKQCILPYNQSNDRRSKRPLQLVHTDLVHVDKNGKHGERYILTFIDDFSNFKAAYCLNNKSDVLDTFKEYVAYVESISQYQVNSIRCDNGSEYINTNFKEFCRSRSIHIAVVDPYSPQLNSVAERNNRTILDKARSLFLQSRLNVGFWPYAVETACFILNRITVKGDRTPVEALCGNNKRPNVTRLRVFGSIAYRHIPKQFRGKFDPKSEKGIMIGYTATGYKLWFPNEDKIKCARNVVFVENRNISNWENDRQRNSMQRNDDIKFVEIIVNKEVGNEVNRDEHLVESNVRSSENIVDTGVAVDSNMNVNVESERTRSVRERKVPKKFDDYVVASYMTSIGIECPSSYREAITCKESEEWKEAMRREIDSMHGYDVWDLVDEKEVGDSEIVNCAWIYSIKECEGKPLFKARLVARGNMLSEEEEDVFSPVVKATTLRTVISVCNSRNMKIGLYDVSTAFLNAKLCDRIVYMKQPAGFAKKGRVCRLKRSIYGLRKSSKDWNACLHEYLLSIGFIRSQHDHCLYIRNRNGNRTYLLVYVDDFFVISDTEDELANFESEISSRFKVNRLSGTRFLGIEIEWKEDTVSLSQPSYIKYVLKRFRMSDCKPKRTPMEVGLKIEIKDKSFTNKPYSELIGCLSYIANMTRPDILYSVNFLSKYQKTPTEELYNYANRILRYLSGTINMKLVYGRTKNSNLGISGYADADFGSDHTDRKSRSGYLFMRGGKFENNQIVHGDVVSWSSIKQKTVSLSSSEAEYISLSTSAVEGIWLANLARDLGVETKVVELFEDNQNAILYANNCDNNRKSKHIDVRYRFINDEIAKGKISVKYVKSENQIADIFTKSLDYETFARHRLSLGLIN